MDDDLEISLAQANLLLCLVANPKSSLNKVFQNYIGQNLRKDVVEYVSNHQDQLNLLTWYDLITAFRVVNNPIHDSIQIQIERQKLTNQSLMDSASILNQEYKFLEEEKDELELKEEMGILNELIEEIKEINAYITYKWKRFKGNYPIPAPKPKVSELKFKISVTLYKESIKLILELVQTYRPELLVKIKSTKPQEQDSDEYIEEEDDEVNEDDQLDPLDPNNHEQYTTYLLNYDPEENQNYIPMNEVDIGNEENMTEEGNDHEWSKSIQTNLETKEENHQELNEAEEYWNQNQHDKLEEGIRYHERSRMKLNKSNTNYSRKSKFEEENGRNLNQNANIKQNEEEEQENTRKLESTNEMKNSLNWMKNSENLKNYYKIEKNIEINFKFNYLRHLIKSDRISKTVRNHQTILINSDQRNNLRKRHCQRKKKKKKTKELELRVIDDDG